MCCVLADDWRQWRGMSLLGARVWLKNYVSSLPLWLELCAPLPEHSKVFLPCPATACVTTHWLPSSYLVPHLQTDTICKQTQHTLALGTLASWAQLLRKPRAELDLRY